MKTVYQYSSLASLPLEASFYPASTEAAKLTLLYFHGGGLIYGERDDLPVKYIELLNDHGYNILAFDYPLAPEVSIKVILESLQAGIAWFKQAYAETLNLTSSDFCLFGRSAGGFLSLLLGKNLTDPSFKGIVSFYGYYSLSEASFNQPSPYYKKYPAVPYMTIYELTQGLPKASAPIYQRFSIYLAYRQTGKWADQLLQKLSAEEYGLNKAELAQLPPTFLAASTADQDVPYSISKKMSELIPHNYFYSVADLPHDFDGDTTNSAGLDAYQQLITWLDQLN